MDILSSVGVGSEVWLRAVRNPRAVSRGVMHRYTGHYEMKAQAHSSM